MKPSTAMSRTLLAVLVAAALAGVIAVPVATGSAPRSRAHASSRLLTGIGNEKTEMLGDALWQRLHTKIVRYIAPYDAVKHSYSLSLATAFIRAAEAQHQQVLVAFYHSCLLYTSPSPRD